LRSIGNIWLLTGLTHSSILDLTEVPVVTGQTCNKFWDEVAVAYSQLKKQEEAYTTCQ
jgi:hypothetical protein